MAGYVAQHYGIEKTLYLALVGVSAGIVVCLFLKETAPRKIRGGVENAGLEVELPQRTSLSGLSRTVSDEVRLRL